MARQRPIGGRPDSIRAESTEIMVIGSGVVRARLLPVVFPRSLIGSSPPPLRKERWRETGGCPIVPRSGILPVGPVGAAHRIDCLVELDWDDRLYGFG